MGVESGARPTSQSKKAGAGTTTPPPNAANPRTPTAKKRTVADAAKKKSGEDERTQSQTPEGMRADLSTPGDAAAGLASAESIAEAVPVVIDPDEIDAARQSFVLRDLSVEQKEQINDASVDEKRVSSLVVSFFGLEEADVDLLKSITLDYHVRNLMFAKKEHFGSDQTAAFFSIMKALLERSVAKSLTSDGALALFRSYIAKHTLPAEKSMSIFSTKQTRAIVEYAMKTFFQHYDLFFYCFTQPQESQISEIECLFESPLHPPPLTTGLSEEKLRLKLETERLQKEEAGRLLHEGLFTDPNKSLDGSSLADGLQTDRKSVVNDVKPEPAEQSPAPAANKGKAKPAKTK